MAQTSPKCPTNRAADFVHYVADCTAAALDLATVSEKPKCPAQRIRLQNPDVALAQSVVVTPEFGPNQTPFNVTILLGPGRDYTTRFPVRHIVSATAAVQAVCMWWYGTGVDINK